MAALPPTGTGERGRGKPMRTRWRFDRYAFDPDRRELSLEGRRLQLEEKPCAVLACLLEHADQVVGRPQLLAAAWPGQIVTDSAVAKAVMKLRAILGADGERLLLTVHGVGYRLATAATRDEIAASSDALHLQPGQPLAQRPNWLVVLRSDEEEAGESWQIQHCKTGELRLLRLASTGPSTDVLRACITAHQRLLHALPHRRDFLRLVEAEEDRTPILAEFAGAGPFRLDDDSGRELIAALAGGPAAMALAMTIIEALAAAHSVGVAHGDLSARHVHFCAADAGRPQAGAAVALDPTPAIAIGEYRHVAPTGMASPIEQAGFQQVAREDVHRLGELLLRVLTGDPDADLSPGWERRIEDPLVRADISRACDADPQRRPRDAGELAGLLRTLPERHAQQASRIADRALLARQNQALARARRRWRWAASALAISTLFALVSLVLMRQAQDARDDARQAEAAAQAINDFLIGDLIGQAEPFYGAGADVRLVDLLGMAESAVERRFSEQPQLAAEVTRALGRIHLGLGLWDRAEALLHQSLDLAGSHWPSGHRQRLETQFQLGDLLVRRARFHDASELYQSIYSAQRHLHGDRHIETWWTRTQLAWIEHELGNSATAATALVRILDEIAGQNVDPSLPELVEHYLALVEHELGRWPEAEQRYLRLRDRVTARRGDEHPASAQIARNLGALWTEMGRPDQAIAILEPALTTITERLGSAHPEVHALQSELGTALLENGAYEPALEMLSMAATARLATLGIEHDRCRHTLSRQAQALFQIGDNDAALALAERVLDASEAHLGPGHPESALFRFRLAQLQADLGQPDAAIDLASIALRDTEALYGQDHPRSIFMREWYRSRYHTTL